MSLIIDWTFPKKKKYSATPFAKQMSLTNNPDYFWDSFLVMTQSRILEKYLASSSDPRLVVLFESSPRRVTLVESSSSSQRVSWSNSRQVMVPHRVILGESSCVVSNPRRVIKWSRDVLVESWGASASIYLFLSVGRKMTPFPETVSDP